MLKDLKEIILKTLDERTIYEDAFGELEVKEAIDVAFEEYQNKTTINERF